MKEFGFLTSDSNIIDVKAENEIIGYVKAIIKLAEFKLNRYNVHKSALVKPDSRVTKAFFNYKDGFQADEFHTTEKLSKFVDAVERG